MIYPKITKINARGNSCNFCDRGKLSPVSINKIYPYDKVYQIEGARGTTVRVCQDCFDCLLFSLTNPSKMNGGLEY